MSDAEDDSVYCFMCKLVETKPSRVIECVQCFRSVHFKCKKLYGNAVVKARKNPFLCSVDCTEMYMRINKQHECVADSKVMNELKAIADAVVHLQAESQHTRSSLDRAATRIKELITSNKQIEASQNFLSEKFEEFKETMKDFKEDVCELKEDNANIRSEMSQWQKEHRELKEVVGKLEAEMDKSSRESVSKNAVLLGIPMTESENLKELIVKFGNAVGYVISPESVVNARRLKTKSTNFAAPILVSFATDGIKEELFAHKQLYGNLLVSALCNQFANCSKRVTIRDELTTYGRELLNSVKELQPILDIKYVWPGRDGKVLIRRVEGGKIEQITGKQQLATLTKTTYKRGLNASASGSFDSSQDPSPKRK